MTDNAEMLAKAKVLSEALPYMRRYAGYNLELIN